MYTLFCVETCACQNPKTVRDAAKLNAEFSKQVHHALTQELGYGSATLVQGMWRVGCRPVNTMCFLCVREQKPPRP